MSFSVNARKIFICQSAVMVLGLVLGIFTTRILNAEGRGIVAIVSVMVSLVEIIFRNGSEVACINYLHKEGQHPTKLINNTLTLCFTSGILGTVLALIFYEPLSKTFFDGIALSFFLIAAPRIVLMMAAVYLRSILLAENRFTSTNILDLVGSISNIVFIFFLLMTRQVSAVSVLWAGTLASLCPVIYGVASLNSRYRLRLAIDWSVWKVLLRFGLKGHASNLLDFFNARTDIMLVSHFLGITNVGIYSVAQLSDRLQLIPNSIAQVLLANLSKDRSRYGNRSHIICRNTVFVTFLVCVAAILFSPLIPRVYGANFHGAIFPFVILVTGTIFIAITKTLKSYIYVAMERPELSLFASILNFITNVILCIFLIPRFGLVGAAFSTVVGYSVYALVHLFAFARESKISFWKTIVLQKEDFEFYKKAFFKKKRAGK